MHGTTRQSNPKKNGREREKMNTVRRCNAKTNIAGGVSNHEAGGGGDDNREATRNNVHPPPPHRRRAPRIAVVHPGTHATCTPRYRARTRHTICKSSPENGLVLKLPKIVNAGIVVLSSSSSSSLSSSSSSSSSWPVPLAYAVNYVSQISLLSCDVNERDVSRSVGHPGD